MTRLWRRALVVSAVASLVAVVLAPALLGGADSVRAQSSSDPIWSATLTVGPGYLGENYLGYNPGGGTLSATTFSHGGSNFAVTWLSYQNIINVLWLDFSWTGSPTFASAYALCFDGVLAFTGTGTQMFGTAGEGDAHSVTSTNPSWSTGDVVAVKLYEGSTCPAAVTAGVTASPSSVSLGENGGTASFDVKLNTQPSSDVTLNLSSSDQTVVTINDTTGQTIIREVTFTSSNWNTAQSVTLTGVNDDLENPGGRRVTTIQMVVNSNDDDYFSNTSVDLVTVTVTDDDATPTTTTTVVVDPSDFSVAPTSDSSPVRYRAAGCGATWLAVDGTVNGRWDDDDCAAYQTARSEAKFYWFSVPGDEYLTVTLHDGGVGSGIRLWPEWATSSALDLDTQLTASDVPVSFRNRYTKSGKHLVEVFSPRGATDGGFRLTVDGILDRSGLSCAHTAWTFTGTASLQGRWDSGCATTHYYREYSLVVDQPRLVTLDVVSPDADPSLSLSTASLAPVDRNDDYEGSNRRARISRTLPAGSYRIKVDSEQAGQGGTFTVSVTYGPTVETCDEISATIGADAAIEGTWGAGCQYSRGLNFHRLRQYDLELSERRRVTLSLESSDTAPRLELVDAAASGGLVVGDASAGTSVIVRNLDAGSYRIRATTENPDTDGSFTLTAELAAGGPTGPTGPTGPGLTGGGGPTGGGGGGQTQQTLNFADVDPGAWYYDYVQDMARREIMRGCGTSPLRFCPDADVTRAEMALYLHRALDLPDPPAGADTFTDVAAGHFAKTAIEAVHTAEITPGCDTEPLRYCPDSNVTQAQMAAFLSRALNRSRNQN